MFVFTLYQHEPLYAIQYQYKHILHGLDVLIIDNLSNGLLSPSVIRPGELQVMIGELELILRKEFPQYTLALSLAESE